MGIDIHAVIETDCRDDPSFVNPDGIAYVTWPRQRSLFAKLCPENNSCSTPKRGFPNPASIMTLIHYGVEVCSDEDFRGSEYLSGWFKIGDLDAIELMEAGDCRTIEVPALSGHWVNAPSNQYPNWITVDELRSICQVIEQSEQRVSPECLATIAAMESLKSGGHQCRLVYWFDV